MVLYAFGRVQEFGQAMRGLLLLESGAACVAAADGDPALVGQLGLFLDSAGGTGVAAGQYLFFSPSFLLSFYGILVTYVAVIVQTV